MDRHIYNIYCMYNIKAGEGANCIGSIGGTFESMWYVCFKQGGGHNRNFMAAFLELFSEYQWNFFIILKNVILALINFISCLNCIEMNTIRQFWTVFKSHSSIFLQKKNIIFTTLTVLYSFHKLRFLFDYNVYNPIP